MSVRKISKLVAVDLVVENKKLPIIGIDKQIKNKINREKDIQWKIGDRTFSRYNIDIYEEERKNRVPGFFSSLVLSRLFETKILQIILKSLMQTLLCRNIEP